MQRQTQLANELWPLLLPRITTLLAGLGGAGSGSGATVGEHELGGGLHKGVLRDDQAPQFLKLDGSRTLTGNLLVAAGIAVDGVDVSAHASDPDAHHARQHSIISGSDHTATGSKWQVVGLTAANTLGLLTPLAVSGVAEAILRTDANGKVTPYTLGVQSGTVVSDSTFQFLVVSGASYQALTAGDVSGRVLVSRNGPIYSDNYFAFAALDGSAQRVHTGSVLVSNNYLHTDRVPSNGLYALGAIRGDASVQTPLVTTLTGQLTLQPVGDVVLDPGGNDVLPGANYQVNLGAINRKYLSLWAAELWVETLVAQETIATIGGRILVGPTTSLTRDLAPADTQIYTKQNQMVSGDRVYMEAAGKVEFMAVASAYTTISTNPPEYRYNVTRNLDGSGANQWYAGDAVFNTGQPGNGFIDLYSLSGIPRAGQSGQRAGPTIVGNVRMGTAYNNFRERWAVGNLNALYDYGNNEYGAAFGNPLTAWIGMDEVNGFRVMSGSTKRAQLDINGNFSLYNSAGAATITLDSAGSSFFAGIMGIGAAGEIRQGTVAGGALYGAWAAVTGFTGLRVWRDGNIGRIAGYNNHLVQWSADTDGVLRAGAGAVEIRRTGIRIQPGEYGWSDGDSPINIVWLAGAQRSGSIGGGAMDALGNAGGVQIDTYGYLSAPGIFRAVSRNSAGTVVGSVSFQGGSVNATGSVTTSSNLNGANLVLSNGVVLSDNPLQLLNSLYAAQALRVGSLLASNDYTHASRVPANGIYSVGAIAIGVAALTAGVMLDVGGQTYMRNALTLDGAIYLDALAAAPAAVAGYLPVYFDNATQTLRARLPGGQIKVITWANA